MVGGVLVERTAKEVIPALEHNFENVRSSLINIVNNEFRVEWLCSATKPIQDNPLMPSLHIVLICSCEIPLSTFYHTYCFMRGSFSLPSYM